jgi:cobalt-zinc-cadmium efflux system outer membrane protein
MTVRLQWLLRRSRPAALLAPTRSAPSWQIAIVAAVAILGQPACAGPGGPVGMSDSTASPATPVEPLLQEALRQNSEIAAARAESDAAQQRVAPAAALEDPMLEVGVLNAPLPFSLRREDMTMKMLGLSQKLPYPGKRELRHHVAVADATSVAHAVDETVNRVLRDVRVAYEELRLVVTSRQLVTETLDTLKQLASIAEARYAVGQATQSDALQAQIQVVRMQQELLRLGQEETMRRSELRRLLGRHDEDAVPITPTRASLLELPAAPETLQRAAQERRPQLKSLAALIEKGDREVELARREYYPDFEVRFSYGQRDRTLDGMPRDDLISLTVAVNLPLWRKSRLEPRVAEANAMRRQAASLAEGQRLETRAALEKELASEHQQRESATLYRSTLMPQTEAAFDSALAAYRVGRVDFLTLLEARMRIYETGLGEAEAIAGHNKAVAEVDFLTGRAPGIAPQEAHQP